MSLIMWCDGCRDDFLIKDDDDVDVCVSHRHHRVACRVTVLTVWDCHLLYMKNVLRSLLLSNAVDNSTIAMANLLIR